MESANPTIEQPDVDALLRASLDRMNRCSAFYRAWFAGHGVDVAAVRGVADLARLPLLDKAQLAEAGRDAWCATPGEVVDVVTTSGTTGRSLLFPLTQGDVARLAQRWVEGSWGIGTRPRGWRW